MVLLLDVQASQHMLKGQKSSDLRYHSVTQVRSQLQLRGLGYSQLTHTGRRKETIRISAFLFQLCYSFHCHDF